VASSLDRPPWYFADFDLRIEDPALVRIHGYWGSLRVGHELPPVDRFDPLDLVPHLGDLFIVRVDPRPAGSEPVLRYTLIGTRLVETLGRDATGQVVQDTFPAGHPVAEVYRRLLQRRVAVRTHGRLDWVNKDYRSFESILLPLVGPDGGIVKVVGAAVYGRYQGSIVGDGGAA
jgi:hypothetical protein